MSVHLHNRVKPSALFRLIKTFYDQQLCIDIMAAKQCEKLVFCSLVCKTFRLGRYQTESGCSRHWERQEGKPSLAGTILIH